MPALNLEGPWASRSEGTPYVATALNLEGPWASRSEGIPFVATALNLEGPWASRVSGTPILTPPSAPTSPTGTRTSNTTATVSASTSAGANTYNLYRSTSSGGEGGSPYQTGLGSPSYNDTGLTASLAYYYKWTAVNGAGESAKSSEVEAASLLPAAPATPSATRTSATTATVTADTVESAETYNLYRSTSTGTEASYETGLSEPSFADTGLNPADTYYYEWTAVSTYGEGARSTEVVASAPPAVPTLYAISMLVSNAPVIRLTGS